MSWLQITTLLLLAAAMMLIGGSNAQLSTTFYAKTCPNVSTIVRGVLQSARQNDIWIFPKIVRLHFHDCFVNVRYHTFSIHQIWLNFKGEFLS